ncbi:MAG: hypothetical protein PVH50_11550, partial [Anaerolineae bacterium]
GLRVLRAPTNEIEMERSVDQADRPSEASLRQHLDSVALARGRDVVSCAATMDRRGRLRL